MKAVMFESYGQPDVLKIKEIAKPEVSDDAVLVRVRASSINVAEWYGMTGLPIARILGGGLVKPKDTRLGADFAGVVEAVGKNVTDFKRGDEVFGGRSGAYAEYVSVKNAIALKPANVTMEEAASVPTAGITALQGLRDHGKIQPGQKVLIHGASGGVGSFAIQIAKALGADVTAVCSTNNVEHARRLGADHVIDYTKQDSTQNGRQYDLILDAAAHRPLTDFKRALTAQGRYVMVGGSTQRYFQMMIMGPWLSRKDGQHFGTFVKAAKPNDLAFLKDLVDAGKVAPVIDRRYPLHEVAEAIRYVEAGHARGKVVITVA